jgi:hypothetical protein
VPLRLQQCFRWYNRLYKITLLQLMFGRTDSFCCTVRSSTVALSLPRKHKFSQHGNKKRLLSVRQTELWQVVVKCRNHQICERVFRLEVGSTVSLHDRVSSLSTRRQSGPGQDCIHWICKSDMPLWWRIGNWNGCHWRQCRTFWE